MLGRIFLTRYQVTRLLGEGGMGRVYLGRQLDLGRQVVIKVMHEHVSSDPKFRERFQRETLLMARFQHPYAVTLYDASLDDPDGPCIVMEYIKGMSLDQLLIRNGRLSPERVSRLLQQFCEVLQAAHNEGIIHRDLKPANLMVVDPDTPYEKIKVMDFGLATLRGMPTVSKCTNLNGEFAVGTPGYMSPEQVRGEDVDHRSDLYSVGIILYELVTGKLPFQGNSSMEVLLAQVNNPPPPFAQFGANEWVPPAVEKLVIACLAKNREDRPASARALADLYDAALEPAHENGATVSGEDTEPNPLTAPEPVVEIDPHAVVHELEAWMPEAIATHKFRGFVQDFGGEVLESVPGRIRVLLGGAPSARPGQKALSWLGLARRNGEIELDLSLRRHGAGDHNLLHILVAMRSPAGLPPSDPHWRARCDQVYCDLRGYLLGRTGAARDVALLSKAK
jgi:serine/threonine-protein kinase